MTTHLKSEHKRKAPCQSSFSWVNENHQKEHTSTGGEVQTQAVFTHKRISITKPLDVQSATPNMETKCSPSPQKPRGVGDDFWGHSDGQRQRRIGVNMKKNCTERVIKLERVVEDLQTRMIAMEGHATDGTKKEMQQMDRDWVTCDSDDTINDTEEVEGSNDSSDGQHRVERTVKKKRRPSYSRYPTHSRRTTTTSPRSFLSGIHNSLDRKGSPSSLPENVDNSHNVVSADGSVVTVNNSTINVTYHINNHHHHVFRKRRY
jgi:hypothetical protein